MHYSGILVRALPSEIDSCLSALESISGVEIHYVHRESGRIIGVQEGLTADSQEDGLRQIRSLARVLAADVVYHFVDDQERDKIDHTGRTQRRAVSLDGGLEENE